MKNTGIKNILVICVGVLIFILLLPVFLWLFIVGGLILIVVIIYSRIKYKRFAKDVQKDFDTDFFKEHQNRSRDSRIAEDVIDVEYSEKEEKPHD